VLLKFYCICNMKMQSKLKLFFLLILSFSYNNIFAVVNDSTKTKLGLLPFVFYTPETNLGYGGFVYSYFTINKFRNRNKKSNTQSYLSYTINKQFSFDNDYQIWFGNNNSTLLEGLTLANFQSFFMAYQTIVWKVIK